MINTSENLPSHDEFRHQAAREAIRTLGLLRTTALASVERLIAESEKGEHPKTVCTAYRKSGQQIESPIKNQLGIRANAFMSEQALSDISDIGRKKPLEAHYLTVLRGNFSMFRYRNVSNALKMLSKEDFTAPYTLRFDVFHQDSCAFCLSVSGSEVGQDYGLLPSSNCTCQTAPYGVRVDVDWLADVDTDPAEGTSKRATFRPKTWDRLRNLFDR